MRKMNVLKVAEIGVTLMNITDLDKAKINDFYCRSCDLREFLKYCGMKEGMSCTKLLVTLTNIIIFIHQ